MIKDEKARVNRTDAQISRKRRVALESKAMESNSAKKSARLAVALMGAYTLAQACVPTLIALSRGASPFLLNAAWRLAGLAGCASFLTARYPRLTVEAFARKSTWRKALNANMLLWLLAYSDMAFFALSVRFVDVSVSAMLYETRPVLLVALTGWLFRSEARYRRVDAATVCLLSASAFGSALVLASQADDLTFAVLDGSFARNAATGAFLALLASTVSSLSAFGFKWSSDLADEAGNADGREETRASLELFGAGAGLAVCNLFAVVPLTLAGIALSESFALKDAAFGAVGGALVGCAGALAWRMANFLTPDLSINAMSCFAPLIGLAPLFALSLASAKHPILLLTGAAAIVAANAAARFRPAAS